MLDRVAVHAALADAHRLQAADALAISDRTPGALAEALGLSSNLLAHHLAVLEGAGVIVRRRSEGDGRRTYVSLRWENPIVAASVTPPPPAHAPRVVFVCTHNSARSQFAASLFAQASSVPVASAGTAPAARIHPHAAATLRTHGLGPTSDAPMRLADVLHDGDLVVAVCDNAFEDLSRASVPHVHWSVPDPARPGGRRDFAHAFQALEPRVKRLAASLT